MLRVRKRYENKRKFLRLFYCFIVPPKMCRVRKLSDNIFSSKNRWCHPRMCRVRKRALGLGTGILRCRHPRISGIYKPQTLKVSPTYSISLSYLHYTCFPLSCQGFSLKLLLQNPCLPCSIINHPPRFHVRDPVRLTRRRRDDIHHDRPRHQVGSLVFWCHTNRHRRPIR